MNKKKENFNKDSNFNTEFSDENVTDFLIDDKNEIKKGNSDQDIRFNPNKNRKQIDQVTSENQLK